MNANNTNSVYRIPLTKGMFAIVDADDYESLIKNKWYALKSGSNHYAARGARKNNIRMHQLIMPSPDGMETDHINGDSLDNRKCNLRVCKHQNNMWNRKPVTGSSSKYKGVSWQAATSYWKAYIKINEKQIHLGCFWEEDDAAIAYNKAAQALHGEFAKLNKVEDRPCQSQIIRYIAR